jgi:CheY-like chemotaxis protein
VHRRHTPFMPPSFVESDTLWVATVSDPGSDLAAPSGAPTVLVVDDEREVVNDLAMALRDLGYEVETACNGADAIERAIALRPALIITDVLMPVIDGIALAKALRQNPATADARIVLSSGVSEASVRALFKDYDAFLQKPYALDDLRITATALLSGEEDR